MPLAAEREGTPSSPRPLPGLSGAAVRASDGGRRLGLEHEPAVAAVAGAIDRTAGLAHPLHGRVDLPNRRGRCLHGLGWGLARGPLSASSRKARRAAAAAAPAASALGTGLEKTRPHVALPSKTPPTP